MNTYVYDLKTGKNMILSDAGGKALNLHELSKINGINVPAGFCITTKAYKELFSNNQEVNSLIDELLLLESNDLITISKLSREIRTIIESIDIPDSIKLEISNNLTKFPENTAYAVRSSATAEDLPTASFAGQQDTYLNIIGLKSILKHIRKCWASLFTDRAVTYRMQNGFNHRHVYLAVIVQRMISSKVSGIMFTADPLTSNRRVISIDASYGLGESLVSGLVASDNYRVMGNQIVTKKISVKKTEIVASASGGTEERVVDSGITNSQTLTDSQILELGKIGRKIESYFSYPQDIEWCLVDNSFSIVQSRPITTLYPLPEVANGENRIFMSAGHMQMMTAPIKPLGLFFFKSVLGDPPSQMIGGRLYTDITHDLATPLGRFLTKSIVGMIGDTLITSSITKIIKDKKLISTLPKGNKTFKPETNSGVLSIMLNAYKIFKKNDPDIIKNLIANEDHSIECMKKEIEKLSGDEVFDFIYRDHDHRRQKITTPPSAGALTAVLLSEKWFNKKIEKWLGIKNAADTFLMSIPNSVTSETGFGLLDVADTIRDYPEIIDYLQHNPNDKTFFEDIARFNGGETVCKSIKNYLSKYGMRCSGDIDITVPRWSEKPTEIVPVILSNIRNFGPNASKLKFDQGITESERIIEELAGKVEKLPGGRKKAKKVRRIARLIRNYIGYREYPKFSYMKRYFIYKQAMLKEAAKLLENGVIKELEDIYYMYFDELRAAINGNTIDYNIITMRKNDFKAFKKLTPPRIMTSYGEIISGEYDTNDIPKDALPGIPVSRGIVEGRARIIRSIKDASLTEGDILVAEFTDPSWTPAFVSIKALITEVGGLMTHGAVIAREYGLPAVVSVENATKLIKNGDMIRVNGTKGYIEILS